MSTYVYEMYAANGSCLYVGRTVNIGRRLNEHQRAQLWWGEVSRIEWAVHLENAHLIEAERIAALRPLYNVYFNRASPAASDAQRLAMATPAPPKRLLLEDRYTSHTGTLAEDVAYWRDNGISWADIADSVTIRTGIGVSRESLRAWYGTHRVPEATRPAGH